MDLQTFQSLLPINKHDLDTEVERHAEYASRVYDATSRANTEQLRAKDELARVEARVYANAKDASAKISVEELKGIVTRNRERIAAFDVYMKAREEYEQWLGMSEAWRARSYRLGNLSDLFAANYFTVTMDSTKSDTRPGWQRDRDALPARAAAALNEPTGQPQGRTRLSIKRRT